MIRRWLVRTARLLRRGRQLLAEGDLHRIRRRTHAELENFRRSHPPPRKRTLQSFEGQAVTPKDDRLDRLLRCESPHPVPFEEARRSMLLTSRRGGRTQAAASTSTLMTRCHHRPVVHCKLAELGGAEKQVVTLLNHPMRPLSPASRVSETQPTPAPATRHGKARCACVLRCHSRCRAAGDTSTRVPIHTRRIDAIVCTNTYSMLYGYLARQAVREADRSWQRYSTQRCADLQGKGADAAVSATLQA